MEALSDGLRFEVGGFGVDVVIIEPGPIKTRFGATAIAAVERVQQSDSPYAKFNAEVAGKIHDALEGWMSVAAGDADSVARAIERGITAGRPRTRYPITAAARSMMFLRRWLPDRAFDAFLRTQYTPPRPA